MMTNNIFFKRNLQTVEYTRRDISCVVAKGIG